MSFSHDDVHTLGTFFDKIIQGPYLEANEVKYLKKTRETN